MIYFLKKPNEEGKITFLYKNEEYIETCNSYLLESYEDGSFLYMIPSNEYKDYNDDPDYLGTHNTIKNPYSEAKNNVVFME